MRSNSEYIVVEHSPLMIITHILNYFSTVYVARIAKNYFISGKIK